MTRWTIILFLTVIFSSTACNISTDSVNSPPGLSWYEKDIKYDTIITNNAGHWRIQHRIVSENQLFDENFILNYKFEVGHWVLIDSLKVKYEDLKSWYENNEPIFTVDHLLKSKYAEDSLPIWIKTDLKFYKFRTGWETERLAFGEAYILLSDSMNQMTVYNLMKKKNNRSTFSLGRQLLSLR